MLLADSAACVWRITDFSRISNSIPILGGLHHQYVRV